MSERTSLSVVMATLNEEKALPGMVAGIRRHTAGIPTEILIVDSSTDRTPEIAAELGVAVVRQPKQGHGVALQKAILSAAGDVIITADCDCTYPMDKIPELVRLVNQEGLDLVSCNRITDKLGREMPASNRFANRAFAAIVRILYGIPVHDVTTGMFAMRRDVAHGIPWETNYSFPSEIIIRSKLAGFKFREIDIPYRERVGQVTLNKWRSGKAYLKCFLKYKFFRTSRMKGL